ncbi:hypothetical protein N665_0652s0005 [Sinapis alba]|nr:hypothetical protein N665_0652s0005 [Sinapis alba]
MELIDREQLKPIYERELMAVVMPVQKWRHYLMGRRFTVHTDQKSLKFLLDQHDISLDYQKWLTKLLGYDFEILYKAGVENKVADGLSRMMGEKPFVVPELLLALTSTSNLQMQDIFEEIDVDDTLKSQLQEVIEGRSERVGYSIRGVVCFIKKRLVLPKNSRFIALIFQEYHSGVVGGHSGVLKTTKRIQRMFHWQNLKKDVQKFVAECQVCQTHKHSTLSPAGLLQPIPIPHQICEELSMDFIDGLPKSEGQNTWFTFLAWAEFWYNSSFHTALKATFEIVYGRPAPGLLRFEEVETCFGYGHEVLPLPESLSAAEELILILEEVLETRYNGEGHLEMLVKWKGLSANDHTWVRVTEFEQQFTSYSLEGKLSLGKGGIDTLRRCYVRKNKKRREEVNDLIQVK